MGKVVGTVRAQARRNEKRKFWGS